MAVTKSVFGKSQEGKEISLYTLSNSKGMQAKVTDLGANLVGILVPDAQGVTADVTLGFDSVDRYYKITASSVQWLDPVRTVPQGQHIH